MEDKKKDDRVFVVKNNYEEIQGIYNSELEANQLAAYLNSKYMKGQPDISLGLHRIKYSVKSYPIKEFYRKRKLYWLAVAYFEISPFTKASLCPYSICGVERNMMIDYEIEDQVNMREEGVHHIYFTAPFKTTNKELDHIGYDKLQKLWSDGLIK